MDWFTGNWVVWPVENVGRQVYLVHEHVQGLVGVGSGWCREGTNKAKVEGTGCSRCICICGPLELTQTLLAGTGWRSC